MADIISIEQVQSYLEKYKNKKLVVTGGCFDLLHIGHITLLENAKKQGDSLIVFVESDEDIKKKKGINRPIHSQKERAHMLSMIKPVDIVVPLKARMTNIDYDNLIQTIKPSVIATTENDSAITHKKRQAKLVGAKVVEVNKYIPSVSTTKLLSILEREI